MEDHGGRVAILATNDPQLRVLVSAKRLQLVPNVF
jgi:hypothetical protein